MAFKASMDDKPSNHTATPIDDEAMHITDELLKTRLSILHDPSLSLRKPNGRSFATDFTTRAAIVVPLILSHGEVHILLIKRSQQVWAARGEMSLPGGIIEETDVDEVDAAFREAREEIGLERHQGSVLAVLKPILGLVATADKGFDGMKYIMLYPVVVLVAEDFRPRTNEEIAEIWNYPLRNFTDFSAVSRIPINYRGLHVHYLLRTIFRGSDMVNESIHGMTMIISTVVAIVTYQWEEPFEFGDMPSMIGNYQHVKRIWDRISRIPVKSNL